MQIKHGMEFIHKSNIIHGDLKCNNILVAKDGIIKITDFGLASFMEANTERNDFHFRYTAPEVEKQKGVRSIQSDIYAFGIIVFEIITGSVLCKDLQTGYYRARRRILEFVDTELEQGIEESRIENIDEWKALVLWCCRKDPQERPANIGEICLPKNM